MAARYVVTLLMASLLVETSVAVTYTAKLIHRYSDEAKSFWISRNGNVSWPNRESPEFFRLLLSGDVKRQRLQVGSQHPLLVPSEGSKTLFYGNDLGWLHYTWIDIGNPNVSFLVALDTGSDLLWVPCDCIQCAPLSSSYYYMLDRDLREYSPSVSSTSKQLSCSHQLCESHLNCRSPKEPCPYNINYNTENTSTSGFLFEDKLHLSSVGEYASHRSAQASVILGCGRKQSGAYLDGSAPNGILGLGLGNISVPSLLVKAGLIRNSFSLCTDKTSSGRIYFGDLGLATQQSTPFLPLEGKYISYIVEVKHYCMESSCLKQTGFQALVDCGTSFTYIPRNIYDKVALEFDKQVDVTRSSIEDFPYCYEASSLESLNIPSMELKFAMNQSFVIQNPMFETTNNQGVPIVCLGMLPMDGIGIIGQNFMMGYRMVFDRENMKLGWSHSTCEDIGDSTGVHLKPTPSGMPPNPLPTNQQQSVPSTQAVAPVVAERAPSKPSGSHLLNPSWLSAVCLLLMVLQHFGCLV